MNPEEKKLTIVIVNYNVKLILAQCLYSVRASVRTMDSEVIVVDNASSDDSVDYLKPLFPEFEFIENRQNTGFSSANNLAIRRAKGKYILLLNPDTVVGEDFLQRICSFMDTHPEAGGVGVKMIDASGRFLPESKRGLPNPWNSFCKMFGLASLFPYSKLFGRYRVLYLDKNSIHRVDVLSGACMLLRAEALTKSGLLDEDYFMYGEDIDLSYNLLKAGYQNYYLPETIIHYKGESTKKDSIRYVRIFYGAMIIFYQKHYPKSGWLFAPFIYMAIFLRASVSALKIPFRRFIPVPKTEIKMPKAGESFSEMIHRIEQKKN
jgi:GT2 family glycosyltransferase